MIANVSLRYQTLLFYVIEKAIYLLVMNDEMKIRYMIVHSVDVSSFSFRALYYGYVLPKQMQIFSQCDATFIGVIFIC